MSMLDHIVLNFEHDKIRKEDLGKRFITKDLTCTGAMYELNKEGIIIQTVIAEHWGGLDDLLESIVGKENDEEFEMYLYGAYSACPEEDSYTGYYSEYKFKMKGNKVQLIETFYGKWEDV